MAVPLPVDYFLLSGSFRLIGGRQPDKVRRKYAGFSTQTTSKPAFFFLHRYDNTSIAQCSFSTWIWDSGCVSLMQNYLVFTSFPFPSERIACHTSLLLQLLTFQAMHTTPLHIAGIRNPHFVFISFIILSHVLSLQSCPA